jgi:parallel beta-helix repeat protein
MTVFRYVAALVFLALAAPAAAHAGGRDSVACGATITSDTKLRADLTNCPGDGVVIGADSITLDLGRRTIDGTGAEGSQGIRLNGRRGVKIVNGTVQEFAVGIGLDDADRNRLQGLTVRANAGRGVNALNGSDQNDFKAVHSTGNATGIAFTASTGSVVRHSSISDNQVTGVLLFGASRNRIEGNRVAGNAGNGVVVVEGSNENRVVGNAVAGGEAGLVVDTAERNLLALNRVTGSGDGVYLAGNANTVAANLIDRSGGPCETCSGYGIGVVSGEGNVLKANLVTRSAADGINVAAPATTIAFNAAARNGDYGIEAVPGVRDGGGNRAWANANAAQCAGVTCRGGRDRGR